MSVNRHLFSFSLLVLQEALQLLDRCDEATAVSADLDFAVRRLEDVLIQAGVNPPARQTC